MDIQHRKRIQKNYDLLVEDVVQHDVVAFCFMKEILDINMKTNIDTCYNFEAPSDIDGYVDLHKEIVNTSTKIEEIDHCFTAANELDLQVDTFEVKRSEDTLQKCIEGTKVKCSEDTLQKCSEDIKVKCKNVKCNEGSLEKCRKNSLVKCIEVSAKKCIVGSMVRCRDSEDSMVACREYSAVKCSEDIMEEGSEDTMVKCLLPLEEYVRDASTCDAEIANSDTCINVIVQVVDQNDEAPVFRVYNALIVTMSRTLTEDKQPPESVATLQEFIRMVLIKKLQVYMLKGSSENYDKKRKQLQQDFQQFSSIGRKRLYNTSVMKIIDRSFFSWIAKVHGKEKFYLFKDVFNVPDLKNKSLLFMVICTLFHENLCHVPTDWHVWTRTIPCCNLVHYDLCPVLEKTESSSREALCGSFTCETSYQVCNASNLPNIKLSTKLFVKRLEQRFRKVLNELPVFRTCFYPALMLYVGLCCIASLLTFSQKECKTRRLKGSVDRLCVKDDQEFIQSVMILVGILCILFIFSNVLVLTFFFRSKAERLTKLGEMKAVEFDKTRGSITVNWSFTTEKKTESLSESSVVEQKWYLRWFHEGIRKLSTDCIAFPASAPGSLEHYFSQKYQGRGISGKDELKYEWLRLQTFYKWPQWAVAYPSELAKAGFYYTKEGDKVVCFSCAGVVQNWKREMCPVNIHKALYPECKFMAGTEENYSIPAVDSSNMPPDVSEIFSRTPRRTDNSVPQTSERGIREVVSERPNTVATPTSDANSVAGRGLDDADRARISRNGSGSVVQDSSSQGFTASQSSLAATEGAFAGTFLERMKQELGRYLTYRTWPSEDVEQSRALAKAGFYYSGLGHKVKCAFCDGNLDYSHPDQEPMVYHARLFPSCPFVGSQNTGNVTNNPAPGSSLTSSPVAAQSDLAMLGIMSDSPKHPEFALLQARIDSFRRWSSEREQSPYDLALAGFIYAGMSDCTKCFHCDGGLRNWLPGDIPWVEHARWFPHCTYVKLCKGQEFIDTVDQQYPRHAIGNNEASAVNTDKTPDAGASPNIDALLSTPGAQTVLEMGYRKEFVKRGIGIYIQQKGGDVGIDAHSLVEILLEIEGVDENSLLQTSGKTSEFSELKAEVAGAGIGLHKSIEDALVVDHMENAEELDTKSLREKNRELIEQTLCKICLENKMCITFLPCGHLVSCAECAPALRKCPICRSNIKGRVRVYMS